MLSMTFKQILAHKLRFLSTAVAVLLGVTLMSGTLIFTDTITSTFEGVLAEANGGVDVLVRAPSEVPLSYGQTGTRIDASLADAVRGVDGVAAVATRVTGYAQLVGPDGDVVGDQSQAPTVGFNWVETAGLNPYRIAAGRAPAAANEVVIDRHTATVAGFEPGDRTTVITQRGASDVEIVGVATFGTADSPAGANTVLFTDAAAQALLADQGRVDGITITAAEGTSAAELASRIEPLVPDEVEVVTADVLNAEDRARFADAFGPFKVFLLVFAVVAMLVGAFLINNTFSITVAQRTQQLAMLRAVGASRRQVLRAVLGEAAAIAVFGAGAGLVAGLGVSIGLRALLGAAGVELPDAPMVVHAGSMAVSASIGIVVTMVSAWMPARRAGRVPPIAAMREVAMDRPGASMRRTTTGTVVTALGVLALLAGLGGSGISLVGLGAFVIMIGIAVLAPVLARPVIRAIGQPLRLRGMPGEMALRNAHRNPKRTARTASSLMIGVALVVFIAVLAASARTSFGGSLATTFRGTHVFDSGAFDGSGGLSTDIAEELQSTAGIDAVLETRVTGAQVAGADRMLQAFTAATVGDLFDLGEVQGDLDSLGLDGIAASTDHASDEGWTIGSLVDVTVATGTRTFEVRALYSDGAEWVGGSFVDLAAFEDLLPNGLDFRVYVSGDDAAVAAVADAHPSAELLTKQAFLDDTNGEIDQILAVIYAMLALAILIAVLGIANTMALSITERTRELGLLRAVGMVRGQVGATIRWEAVTISIFGATLGLAIGTFFGWATVRALASEGIDQLTMPVATLVVVATVAALAGAAAALLPARRAARMDVLQALSTT